MKKILLLCLALTMLITSVPATFAVETNATPVIRFSSVDQHGNTITEAILADKTVVMINFWATWCGPCLSELADLQRLYSEKKDQGFLILGVLVDSMPADAAAEIAQNGITYPVISIDNGLYSLKTSSYIPESIFVDYLGRTVDEPYIGSQSYSSWKTIIERLMGTVPTPPASSSNPTQKPTTGPTIKPTATPTLKPTATPTVKPTASPVPTVTNTPAPVDPVTVEFYVDSNLYSSVTIERGATLTKVPIVPEMVYRIGRWDPDNFTNIMEDMRVDAVYFKLKLDEEGGYISNIPDGTDVEALLFCMGYWDLGSADLIATGTRLNINDKIYTLAVMGDINCDASVSAADASCILRALVELEPLDKAQRLAAGETEDRPYTAANAALILRYLVELEKYLAVSE